jgi:hypothetical protein
MRAFLPKTQRTSKPIQVLAMVWRMKYCILHPLRNIGRLPAPPVKLIGRIRIQARCTVSCDH